MKKRTYKKTIMAIALGVAVSSLATSSFAACYQVKPNDTLVNIAEKKSVNLLQLLRANPHVSNPDLIYPGMIIKLPGNTYGQAAKPGTPSTSKPSTSKPAKQQQAGIDSYAQAVFAQVNQERAKAGLSALKLDSSLSRMALDKAKDMATNKYFDHTSPTYGSPFDMMKTYGISYTYAGENIAMGQRNAQEVMKDWMNSPGHRQNILGKNYDTIGVAYYNGYWVQEFTGHSY